MTFRPRQYLCAALRPGNAVSVGTVALLSRLLPLLRCAFPQARFLVDSSLSSYLDACPRLDYVVSMPKNRIGMTRARARSARTGHTARLAETRYAAGPGSRGVS